MHISDTSAPLLISALRDAIVYHRQLLTSETLRNRWEYEEHLVELTQFFEEIKEEYKRNEAAIGLPLDELLPGGTY
jgi:hypothetical protein